MVLNGLWRPFPTGQVDADNGCNAAIAVIDPTPVNWRYRPTGDGGDLSPMRSLDCVFGTRRSRLHANLWCEIKCDELVESAQSKYLSSWIDRFLQSEVDRLLERQSTTILPGAVECIVIAQRRTGCSHASILGCSIHWRHLRSNLLPQSHRRAPYGSCA